MPAKRDYGEAEKWDWPKLGLGGASPHDKARFVGWLRWASESAPYLIEFIEMTLDKYQRGVFGGNIIFLGRSAEPFYHIAHALAPEYQIPTEKLVLLDLTRKMMRRHNDTEIFKYLGDNGAFDGDSVTLIDEGGVGRMMSRLKRLIIEQSDGEIKPKSFQLASLYPTHRTMLTQRPWKAGGILKAALFLASNQPHSRVKPERLTVDDDGLSHAEYHETSGLHRLGTEEVRRVLLEEAGRRHPRNPTRERN